ncbi:MAG TPA: ABC transporter permease, partial [Naasia sp.]
VGYLRINPIIATLGTGSVLLGLSQLLIGGGIVYGEASPLSSFLRGNLLGIPVFVWIFAIVALILTPVLSRTAFGRWNLAVGGNYEASAASAVPVRLTKASAFVLTGFLSGLCGVLLALSNGQARPIIGTGYEFVAITAVVIGGTSLFGGSGSIPRTVGGVLITALIGNLIILSGLPTQATGLVTGAIVLVAVGVDVYFRRKAGRE